MVLGLVQFVFGGDRLKGIGGRPSRESAKTRERSKVDIATIVLAAVGASMGLSVGWFGGGRQFVACLFPTVVGAALGYIIGTVRQLRGDELKRVVAIFILFFFSILFWMSFEQGATSLNLFADRLTRNSIFGHAFPSSWYQAVQPAFVILLAPAFAALWVRLGRHNPSSPAKFAFGLFFAALAFTAMAYASLLTRRGSVSPIWLVFCYFIQTLGELCLSPVGLSTVTKLAPARMVGLMMGVWFLSVSFGDFIAGLSTRFFNPGDLVRMFGGVAGITFVAALLLFLLVPLIKKLIPREVEA
jgi:POT family proton-dependent oligopeptide transporter